MSLAPSFFLPPPQAKRNLRSLLTAVFSIFGACALLLIQCACGKADAPSALSASATSPSVSATSASASNTKSIALVMKTMSNPFFVEMEKGAQQAAKELGLTLLVRAAASETSIEQQIQLIDDLVTQKVGAIIIAPGDSQRLVPVLKRTQMAGIFIVNIDNRLNPEAMAQARMGPVPFVGVDNEQASYQAVKYIAEQIKQPSKAAILEGLRTAENANLRLRGARRAFAENTAIQVVASESANWKIDEAYALTAKFFKQHPDIRLLFCANDMMALGALKFLQDHDKQHVLIASYDALSDVKSAIKAGKIAVSVDQQAAQQGFHGVQLAYRMLQGENVVQQLKVEARLVRAADLP